MLHGDVMRVEVTGGFTQECPVSRDITDQVIGQRHARVRWRIFGSQHRDLTTWIVFTQMLRRVYAGRPGPDNDVMHVKWLP